MHLLSGSRNTFKTGGGYLKRKKFFRLKRFLGVFFIVQELYIVMSK